MLKGRDGRLTWRTMRHRGSERQQLGMAWSWTKRGMGWGVQMLKEEIRVSEADERNGG